jgi:octopine/nopaline transport system substrate-binding protein
VGSIQGDLLNTYFKGVINLRTYKTADDYMLDLNAERIDAVLTSAALMKSMMDKPGGDQLAFTGPAFRGGMIGLGVGVGIRKTDPELKAMFDRAIEAAIADGTMKRLSLQWFHLDMSPH